MQKVIGIDFTSTPTARKPIPYTSHLLAGAGIGLEASAGRQMDNIEGVTTGALLHDAIADRGHKTDLDQDRTGSR